MFAVKLSEPHLLVYDLSSGALEDFKVGEMTCAYTRECQIAQNAACHSRKGVTLDNFIGFFKEGTHVLLKQFVQDPGFSGYSVLNILPAPGAIIFH